ncbi:PREDICTED: anthocyanidin 3-O-glucosyltransferase 5-like [Fragaria vesca subsp. vesca]
MVKSKIGFCFRVARPCGLHALVPDLLIPEVLLLCNRIPLLKGVLVNTWEELEPVTLNALRNHPFFVNVPTPTVHPIGPLTKDKEAEVVGSELLTWLDKQPCDSVVYVSFGSGGRLSAEQTTELAHGLELSGKRFLWLARRPKANDSSGSFFEAGCGDGALTASYFPDGFLERTQGAGLVTETWAPQVAVLSHPSVCGFVTHCGWNSVMESVVHGVTMVAWPLYAEQKMNARAFVEMGVAVWPEAGEDGVVGRGEVERVVRMVVEGEEGKEMRRRVREIQRSAAEALGGGGLSCGCLSRLGMEWRDGTHGSSS